MVKLFDSTTTLPKDYIHLIKHMIDEGDYRGEVSETQFLIKRNFGVRRMPILGKLENEIIVVTVKNELTHQIIYILGYLVLVCLFGLSLYIHNYQVTLLIGIFLLLLVLVNYNQKRKELNILKDKLYN